VSYLHRSRFESEAKVNVKTFLKKKKKKNVEMKKEE
jgi:hypothetical protein